jgi:uncharacterized membrane protein
MKRALLVVLAACDPAPMTIDQAHCPSQGTTLTYDNFGAQFFASYCNRCHAANAPDRHGAPDAYAFDTLTEIHQRAARIFVNAAGPNTTMPPGPSDPPLDERDQLAEWLACGAP